MILTFRGRSVPSSRTPTKIVDTLPFPDLDVITNEQTTTTEADMEQSEEGDEGSDAEDNEDVNNAEMPQYTQGN